MMKLQNVDYWLNYLFRFLYLEIIVHATYFCLHLVKQRPFWFGFVSLLDFLLCIFYQLDEAKAIHCEVGCTVAIALPLSDLVVVR